MMEIVKPTGADWWGGVTLVNEFTGTDLIGDGTSPITLRLHASRDGNLNFELEDGDPNAGGQAFVVNKTVTAGWNNISIDVSGADASVNWHKFQVRPDADGQQAQASDATYYIDDVHFPNATIVLPPNDPTTTEFLGGGDAPTAAEADVVSLFSDTYAADVTNFNPRSQYSSGGENSQLTIDNNNEIQKYEAVDYIIMEADAFDASAASTLNFSVYKTGAEDILVKIYDLGADGAWQGVGAAGSDDTEGTFTVSTAVQDAWTEVSLDLTQFAGIGDLANASQVILDSVDGLQTLYVDDVYFAV